MIGIKLFTQANLTVLNIENGISKLCIKMLIKRKTRARKAYAYRMLLNLKMLEEVIKSLKKL